MRRLPHLASRAAAATFLCLALVAPALPAAPALAQDDVQASVADAFEVSGDAGGRELRYDWEVSVAEAQWTLSAQGPAEELLTLELFDADGALVERASERGRAGLYDVALAPGRYAVVVPRRNADAFPIELEVRQQVYMNDPEPNDHGARAAPIADGELVFGRLARSGNDVDRFVLSVPAGDRRLRDVALTWDTDEDRQLCLMDGDARLQCRGGPGSVALTDLALEPGSHQLQVSGRTDENLIYKLRVEPTRERRTDFEAEPNDEPGQASAFEAAAGVSGRSSREDYDLLAVTVSGEPQLWQVELAGAEVDQLAWVRRGRDAIAQAVGRCDGQPLTLYDLYLEPGTHQFRVRTCAGEYDLRMTPLGPPDPDNEREPNNDDVRAEAYQLGQRRVGRLVTSEDFDRFRFSVAAPELVTLELASPADASVEARLATGGTEIFRVAPDAPGDPLTIDLWLDAGEYLLTLRSPEGSDGRYELTTDRRSPFDVPADAEPNDALGFAREAPASLAWTATRAGRDQDVDGYRLPPLDAAGPIRIEVDDERPSVRLYADVAENERVELEREESGALVAQDPPVGQPLYLELHTQDDYAIRLEAPGWTPVEPAELPVELTLDLATEVVAAYWPQGQAVAASIGLDNGGSEDLELDLRTATSHWAWRLVPEISSVVVPAGGRREVAASLVVGPDAWADAPVLVSVAAYAADGAHVGASVSIDAARDFPAVDATRSWPLPDELLGGLNVASAALGAVPAGTVDPDREALLFDDLTPAGSGFGNSVAEFPLEIAVDLAGDGAVPVAGTILNPLSRGSRLSEMVRDFELLLSTDGETWTSVLEGALERTPRDQPFVLDEPVPATQAMLRIHSLHGPRRGSYASLGEWKVIAVPGVVPDDMSANLAEPVRGGYVARIEPFVNGFDNWRSLLDEELDRQVAPVDRDVQDEFELVVGFQEGRAARISELRWFDSDGSLPGERLDSVDVEVSTQGPLGPWEPLGTWTLERDATGTVAPLVLEEPTWARYVRLRGPLPPEDVRRLEMPGRVEILEVPGDGSYRSILGEWGYTFDGGPFEWSATEPTDEVAVGDDAGDTPEDATALALATQRTDRAEVLQDVDWYRIDVPATDNTLAIDVTGVPTVGVTLQLFDAAGSPQQLALQQLPDGSQRHAATVEPGASYRLLVEQPPFNVVFTFDTSGSMGPYLAFVLEGLREFAGDVEPGRETAMIVPFDRQPLLEDWSDDPERLVAAANGFMPADDSSNVERGLLAGAELLAPREGTRAILVVGDAETGTLDEGPLVWRAFEQVQPIVYAVHVGSDARPEDTRNLMRGWSDAYGGVYSYPTTHAEMERAFERMSTRLRRPAVYGLTAATSFVNREPGSLRVVAPPATPAPVAAGVAVEIILDTSGSMRKRIEGKRRIAIARASLQRLVRQSLPQGLPVALRTFGVGSSKPGRCRTKLEQPLEPLEKASALRTIKGLGAAKKTQTPIAAALRAAGQDLGDVEGQRLIVLITDGGENCGGDPLATIEALRAEGVDVSLNIVGFALDDEELKAQMGDWAGAGGGSYFDAVGAADLTTAVTTALSAPFRVYAEGESVALASGTVGGDPVPVEPGTYRLEILTEPPAVIEAVTVAGGADVSVTLPSAEPEPVP